MQNFEYDAAIRASGFPVLCGVDEAGRGPLAGPVFAAAVVFPDGVEIPYINDSKKLSEKRREELFGIICDRALTFGIGSASVEEIDTYNILQADFMAMRRAVAQLDRLPSLILVDGNLVPPELPAEAKSIVKGDALSASIAAASILAKVSRDRYMLQLNEQYPQYRFDKHKGYGTALHYEMLNTYGISPVHRRTFLKKWMGEER